MSGANPAFKLGIIRVLGNELPPRDPPGSRLRSLEFVLGREQDLHVPTRWVVNRLHDAAYREAVLRILQQCNQSYVEIPFDPEIYKTQSTDHGRLLYAVNINGARNFAIRLGAQCHDFTAVLDQDCYFTPALWQEFRETVLSDQARQPRRQCYALAMKRMLNPEKDDHRSLPDTEPQLVFRKDCRLSFRENLRFGQGDKVDLLHDIGFGAAPAFRLRGDICRMAGTVLHWSFAEPAVEGNTANRVEMRRCSLARLLERLGVQAGDSA